MNKTDFKTLRDIFLTATVIIIPAAAAVAAFPCIWNIFLPFLIAFFVYVSARPLNKIFLKAHFPPSAAAFFSLIIIVGVLFGVIYLVFSTAIKELIGLSDNLSEIYSAAVKTVDSFQGKFMIFKNRMLLGKTDMLLKRLSEGFMRQLSDWTASFTSALLEYAKNMLSVFAAVFTAVLAAFFLLRDSAAVSRFFRRLCGNSLYGAFMRIKKAAMGTLALYLRAQLLICSIVFLFLFIGFCVLNVDYALLFALVIALIDAVPILGTGSVLIPWSLFCLFTDNPTLGWGLIVLYGICTIVRQLCEPKIIGSRLGIHPLATVFSIYAGFRLFGIIGLILGPVFAVFVKGLIFSDEYTNIS